MQVASVQPGDEERVRQFVEGVVLEANTTLVGEDELYGSQPANDDDHEPDSEPSQPSRDEQLTSSFRDFAKERGTGED